MWAKQNFGPFSSLAPLQSFSGAQRQKQPDKLRPQPYTQTISSAASQMRVFQSQVGQELMILQCWITRQPGNVRLPAPPTLWSPGLAVRKVCIPLHPPHNLLPSPHSPTLPLYVPFIISLLLFAPFPQLTGFIRKKSRFTFHSCSQSAGIS